MAEELGADLGLEQIRFMPAGRPPHRDQPHASALQRTAMVKLAIAGNSGFVLDTRELDRAGPSFMVDTLLSLRTELGHERPLALLLGADAFLGLPGWHRWQSLFDLAHIVVAHRPGVSLDAESPLMSAELRAEWQGRFRDAGLEGPAGSILLQTITALDISASDIRTDLQHHRSPRYLLPDAVCDYIHTHHLYQKEPHAT